VAGAATFEEFARDTATMLQRTAWLLTRDAHASEDLVQETLAKMYVVWTRRRPIDNPAAYARTVLVREFISRRRRRSSTEVVTDTLPEHGTDQDRSATLALRAAMSDMDPRDQAVLVLRYFVDRTVAEVADDLHLTESAVRTRASRALGKLRARLGDDFLTTTR
jgi:RNA polymerase sigma-70 factor (sigma-E family)